MTASAPRDRKRASGGNVLYDLGVVLKSQNYTIHDQESLNAQNVGGPTGLEGDKTVFSLEFGMVGEGRLKSPPQYGIYFIAHISSSR